MRVLIVESDVLNAVALEKEMKAWGHNVDIVETGTEGLEHFRTTPCDVVLHSPSLPDMQATEFITHLKNVQYDISIIVIADNPARDLEIAIRAQGIVDYLIKPINLTILKQILDHLARKKRTRTRDILLRYGKEAQTITGESRTGL